MVFRRFYGKWLILKYLIKHYDMAVLLNTAMTFDEYVALCKPRMFRNIRPEIFWTSYVRSVYILCTGGVHFYTFTN